MKRIYNAVKKFLIRVYKKIAYTKTKILVIGSQKTGKTSFIESFFNENDTEVNNSTKRVNVSRSEIDNHVFVIYDIPGEIRYNTKWDYYYKKCDLVLFIVDYTMDDAAFLLAKNELQNLLYQNSFLKRPLLVMVNKDEIHADKTINDVVLKLELNILKRVDVECISISVKKKNNYSHIKDWLYERINSKNSN